MAPAFLKIQDVGSMLLLGQWGRTVSTRTPAQAWRTCSPHQLRSMQNPSWALAKVTKDSLPPWRRAAVEVSANSPLELKQKSRKARCGKLPAQVFPTSLPPRPACHPITGISQLVGASSVICCKPHCRKKPEQTHYPTGPPRA